QKGGVAKTTTSVNLAAGLAYYKKKVLLLDLDPQGNASSGLGVNKNALEHSTYDVLVNFVPIDKITVEINKKLSLVPAKVELAGAEMELVSAISRESRLKNALEEVRDQYDYIIIDTPPSLGLLTLNALTAADSFLVPIQCEYFALEGLSQLLSTIKIVQKNLNPKLEMEGILMTMFDNRTNLANQVVADVKENFKDKVFKTIIPRNVRLSEAPSFGMSIIDYDIKSKGAETYLALAKEVIKHG
ncbi:MAG: ParA family protein, partial [Peptococcaceae bacterium]|nr:ParA family protein [Peptococcaceae bacterium]